MTERHGHVDSDSRLTVAVHCTFSVSMCDSQFGLCISGEMLNMPKTLTAQCTTIIHCGMYITMVFYTAK